MGRRSLLHKHCDSEEITFFICHVISQDNVILKGHAALWLGSRQGKSPACHNWCPQALWQWRYNCLRMSPCFGRPREQRGCDFIGKSTSQEVTTLSSLLTIGIFVVEIKCFQWFRSNITHARLNPSLLFISKEHCMKSYDISCSLLVTYVQVNK